jgi:hypothetical protein
MVREAGERRDGRPVIPTSLVEPAGARAVADWVLEQRRIWRG